MLVPGQREVVISGKLVRNPGPPDVRDEMLREKMIHVKRSLYRFLLMFFLPSDLLLLLCCCDKKKREGNKKRCGESGKHSS